MVWFRQKNTPNGRRVNEDESNRNGKPMHLDKMGNNREGVEIGKYLADETIPYSVSCRICV